MRTHNTRVTFKKARTNTVHTGTFHDDGLSSLSPVLTDSGDTVYLSALDTILHQERIPDTPEGEYEEHRLRREALWARAAELLR